MDALEEIFTEVHILRNEHDQIPPYAFICNISDSMYTDTSTFTTVH